MEKTWKELLKEDKMSQIDFRMTFPARSIHLVFYDVDCKRSPVLKLQQPYKQSFPPLPSSDSDSLVMQNDVVFIIHIPGTRNFYFPGVLNELNRGFLVTAGVFKGLAVNLLRIPRDTSVALGTCQDGYSYTTNYTRFALTPGTPLVMGEPEYLRTNKPLARNLAGHELRTPACLRPWDTPNPDWAIRETSVPKLFTLLDQLYEPWTSRGPAYSGPPTKDVAYVLFLHSVRCHLPHVSEEKIYDYWRYRGPIPLRLKRKYRQFYPNDLDVDHLEVEVVEQEYTHEPVVMMNLDNEAVTTNSSYYWAKIFTLRMLMTYPLDHVFDVRNPLRPVDQETVNQTIRDNMNVLSLYAIQMDIGTQSLVDVAELNAIIQEANQAPAAPEVDDRPPRPPLSSVVAIARSWLARPGNQFNVTILY